jgi:hypothetical protein
MGLLRDEGVALSTSMVGRIPFRLKAPGLGLPDACRPLQAVAIITSKKGGAVTEVLESTADCQRGEKGVQSASAHG